MIALIGHSNAVLTVVLGLTGRHKVLTAARVARVRRECNNILNNLDRIKRISGTAKFSARSYQDF